MTVTVWVNEWQYACCGGRFAVGDTVTWTISPVMGDRLAALLGEERALHVAGVEDHHESLPGGVSVNGRICEIVAVLLPPAGVPVDVHVHSSGTSPRAPSGSQVQGWLVRLERRDPDVEGERVSVAESAQG